jgi:cytochrome P450
MTATDPSTARGPVEPYAFRSHPGPPLAFYERMDAIGARSRPFFWSEEAQGYWVFTDHDVILDGLQHPELFSSAAVVPTEPAPLVKWIPIMLDPPEHTKWRHLLAPYFAPDAWRAWRGVSGRTRPSSSITSRRRAPATSTASTPSVFLTTIFLQLMGAVPTEQLPRFLERWRCKILLQQRRGTIPIRPSPSERCSR